jgi:hypothetical protein
METLSIGGGGGVCLKKGGGKTKIEANSKLAG